MPGLFDDSPDPFDLAADLFDPPKDDIFQRLGYTPSAKQIVFHEATEYDVLYGGAAGGGKTRALVMDDIKDAWTYPGIRIGAFRRTYDELAESLLKELQDISYGYEIGCSWNATQKELRFTNGSLIRYRYAETEQDASRRQGGEYQKLTIDERGLMPPGVVSVLSERLRSGRRDIPVLGIRSGTNPGGPGHAYLKLHFVDATDYGKNVVADSKGRTVRFIPSKVSDNPYVNVDYQLQLESIEDPARRAAMLDGNWDTFSGQMFTEWNRAKHIVPTFDPPAEWERRAGIDYGYAAPWAVVWVAIDNDSRVWVYREFYDVEVGENDQAQRIIDAEILPIPDDAPTGSTQEDYMEYVTFRAADPSMWSKDSEANPIATTYINKGCFIQKANNNRLSGWQRLHTFLGDAPACRYHRELGFERCPRLHVMAHCDELSKAIPGAPRDKFKVEDIDTNYPHDHDLDALRYVLMTIGEESSFYFAGDAGGGTDVNRGIATTSEEIQLIPQGDAEPLYVPLEGDQYANQLFRSGGSLWR